MWQKFSLYDFRVIAHYLGVLVLFLAVAQCVPFGVALVLGEWNPASRYLLGIGIALVVGSLLRMCLVTPGKLSPKQALAVTGFAWLVLALLAAIPMALSGHYGSYLDAVFEGMSSWTTTGASLTQDLDHMSIADNTWRFTMQCIGGQGVVVIALSLGLFGRAVDSSLYSSEGRSEHVIPNIMQTTRFIVRFSAAFIVLGTFVLTGLCLFVGMEPLRAFFNGLWLAVASFNTGGMAAMSTGILYYHSGLIEVVVMILILMYSTGISSVPNRYFAVAPFDASTLSISPLRSENEMLPTQPIAVPSIVIRGIPSQMTQRSQSMPMRRQAAGPVISPSSFTTMRPSIKSKPSRATNKSLR